MKQQIKSWFYGRLLYECEAESILEALQKGVAGRANLAGANLARANLARANLARANLDGANLADANLVGAKINWNSHALIGEILRRAAGDDVQRRCLAGGIAISTDWCWGKMLSMEHPEKAWAIGVLLPWIRDGDNAPEQLLRLKKSTTPAKEA
jgi:hypothetical protein